MRGASVHVARSQVTLGGHSRCDSHVGSSKGTKSNRSLEVYVRRSFSFAAGLVPLSPLAQTLFSVHVQSETAGEMLEEVHKGLRRINALKVAIDRRLSGVAIFCHAKLFEWIIRCFLLFPPTLTQVELVPMACKL